MHFGAAFLADAGDAQWRSCRAVRKLHLMHLAVSPDGKAQPAGQPVDHRHADAVQPARDLVGIGIELAAGVQLRHHDLGRRALLFVVVLDAGGNAAPEAGDFLRRAAEFLGDH